MSDSVFHPVFLTRAEVVRLKSLLGSRPDLRAVAEKSLLGAAEKNLLDIYLIPGSFHAPEAVFSDPVTGAPLDYDPKGRGSYRTADGRVLSGPEFDWAWDAITHDRNANAARRCALAGLLTENDTLLVRAKALLFDYAEVYPGYPPHGRQSATWGKLFYQALNESVWSLSMLWATECLWHAGRLSPSELATLRDRLFFPLVDLVWGEWYFIHNIRMWHNAAIGCIGLAFQDREAIRHAIHGDKGFRQQLVDGYRWKDGFSCEGTLGYHGYGLTAMLFLAEAMQRNGYDPYHDPHLLRAILISYQMVQPDGAPPTLGDMGRAQALPTRIYATAVGRYPDHPVIAAAAALSYQQWAEREIAADPEGSKWNDSSAYYFRNEVDWLLNWDLLQAKPEPAQAPITVFPDSGIAISRPQRGSYLLLKAAARTGAHDHHDRLAFIWWENDRLWFGDPGTCYYSHPYHEGWFKHTASHNCALVDGKRQERSEGKIVDAETECLSAKAKPYPGEMPDVALSRCLRRIDQGWEDEFTLTAEKSRTLDLLFHPLAAATSLPSGGEPAEFSAEFLAPDAIRNLRQFPLADLKSPLLFNLDGQTLEITFPGFPGDAVLLLGEAPSDPQDQLRRTPFLSLRARGTNLTFQTRLRVTS